MSVAFLLLFSLVIIRLNCQPINVDVSASFPGWKGSYSASADVIARKAYHWQLSDGLAKGVNDGAMKRCEEENGPNNCRVAGGIVYPKCPDGYENDGCCLCHKAMAGGRAGQK